MAGEFDLVVLAGDHLDIASIVEPDAQIAVVLEYMSRMAAKTAVAACSGNHDLNGRNEHGELSALWLDGARASGSTASFASIASALSITASTDGSFAITSAVAGTPSNNDISPTHAPGSVTVVMSCPAFSTGSPPSSNTNNVVRTGAVRIPKVTLPIS